MKLSIFVGDMILYLNDPPKKHQKTPRHHKQLQQSGRIQINLQNSVAFLYTNNEQTKKEQENDSIHNCLVKKKTHRSKLRKG
jgi:hypothetical protein